MKLNKKQKRTATIASMAALLAVVLGMGGQTFAKYITTKDVAATATVAKWGFVVNQNLDTEVSNMFVKQEKNSAGELILNAEDESVAPGVTGGSFTISFTGVAEVRAKLTVRLSAGYSDVYLNEGADYYYPIVWTVSDGKNDNNYESLKALGEALAGTSSTNGICDQTVEAGDPVAKEFTISWDWAFEDNDTDGNSKPTAVSNIDTKDSSDKLTKDEADTILGMAAAGKTITGYEAKTKLNFNFEISLTQIQ